MYDQPRSQGPLSSFLEKGRESTLGTKLMYNLIAADVTANMLVKWSPNKYSFVVIPISP